jgi:hypothetical protein
MPLSPSLDEKPAPPKELDEWEGATESDVRPRAIEEPKPPLQLRAFRPVNPVPVPGPGSQGQIGKRPEFVPKNGRQGSRTLAHRFPKNTPPWFVEYDTDGDGRVSLSEWKEREGQAGEFSRYDLNGDGYITLAELVRSGQFISNMPTPMVVAGLGSEIGTFYYFELTGTTQGNVWGDEVYSHDSLMAAAAVHAGVLKEGETAFVKVSVLPGEPQYYGSFSNGVTSQDRQADHKSIRIEAIR